MNDSKKYLTIETIILKTQHWCAYQERSQFELDKKLVEYNLTESEKLEVISNLITNNFINEERFAKAFTSGKFKIKKWGKLKIKAHLKLHKVSPKLINQALNIISEDEYNATIENLINFKLKTIKPLPAFIKKQKIINFLQTKGFEFDLIMDEINKIKM